MVDNGLVFDNFKVYPNPYAVYTSDGILTKHYFGVDPLAIYNPVMETELYGDGQHNGGGILFWE